MAVTSVTVGGGRCASVRASQILTGTLDASGLKRLPNPESVKETERLFGRSVTTKGRPESMNVHFHKSKFDDRLLRLSVLRAAYLAGIAVAAYRWIPFGMRSGGRSSTRPSATRACHSSFATNRSILATDARWE